MLGGKRFKINGKSSYFHRKYGTSNPDIIIECNVEKNIGEDWRSDKRIAVILYQMREVAEKLPMKGLCYYGHVNGLGEIVHESELEEIK